MTTLPDTLRAQYTESKAQVEKFLTLSIRYRTERWLAAGGLTLLYILRILIGHSHYMLTYFLYMYVLVAFIAFITPYSEDETGQLPMHDEDDAKGYRRTLPEFDFWIKYVYAHVIAFLLSLFGFTDIPVYVPILIIYALVLTGMLLFQEIERGRLQNLTIKETVDRWFNTHKPSYVAGANV